MKPVAVFIDQNTAGLKLFNCTCLTNVWPVRGPGPVISKWRPRLIRVTRQRHLLYARLLCAESFHLGVYASTILLSIHSERLCPLLSLPPSGPEIPVKKRDAMFYGGFFGNGYYQLVLLALAVEKRGSESVVAAPFRQTCRRVQPQRIAVEAATGLTSRNLPEKSLRIVVSPDDQGRFSFCA